MTIKTTEPRRATEREIDIAKAWVRANNAMTPAGWDPTAEPEYAEALEIIIFANGGRYAPAIDECRAVAAATPQDLVHVPRRDDQVAAWLKRHRDRYAAPVRGEGVAERWIVLDGLLTDYLERADTGLPLSEEV